MRIFKRFFCTLFDMKKVTDKKCPQSRREHIFQSFLNFTIYYFHIRHTWSDRNKWPNVNFYAVIFIFYQQWKVLVVYSWGIMSILRNFVQSVSPKQNVSLVPYYMRDFLCAKNEVQKKLWGVILQNCNIGQDRKTNTFQIHFLSFVFLIFPV